MTRSQRAAMTAIRHLSEAINGLTEIQCSANSLQDIGLRKAERNVYHARKILAELLNEKSQFEGISDDQD